MSRKAFKRPDAKAIEEATYTTVDKGGRVVWEPGLPATVTSRRQPRPQRKVDQEDLQVNCDLKAVLKMSSETKPDWLYKALKAVPKGKAAVQDIYTCLTHPKFVSGVNEWHGQRMYSIVKDHIILFPEKQRKTLLAKCELAKEFHVRSRSQSRSGRRSASHSPSRVVARDSVGRSTGLGQAVVDLATSAPDGPNEASPSETVLAETTEEKEQRANVAKEREKQREEELRKQLAEKKEQEERERLRKAKLGGAFKLDDDDDDDDDDYMAAPSSLSLTRGQRRVSEDGRFVSSSALDLRKASGSQSKPGVLNPRFVESMGGDHILKEVHALLMQKVAPENRRLAAVGAGHSASTSRSRSRSRSRRPWHRPRGKDSGSLRSPTPDGHARGQMRAARKAKMIAMCVGFRGTAPP